MNEITYDNFRHGENREDVFAFIGSGAELESPNLIAFTDFKGRRVLATWGDTITRLDDGLHLTKAEAVS